MNNLIEKVCQLYSQFNPELLVDLDSIYDSRVLFKDPLHEIHGLDKLRNYYAEMMQGLDECHFEFDRVLDVPDEGECVLFWSMRYRHSKLAGGKLLVLTGNSHLRYSEKVYYHRDYFDAGAMLYEQVPLLGSVIGYIKKRLVAK